jgi:hypothetical protein
MMRIVHILTIATLILAAAFVYKIKFDSTLQAERVAKLRGEIRRERDAIALLRAEWTKLDTPSRLEDLAQRYLPLKPIAATQFDSFDRLPERPPQLPVTPADPIGAMIDRTETTGSVGAAAPNAPPDTASRSAPR